MKKVDKKVEPTKAALVARLEEAVKAFTIGRKDCVAKAGASSVCV